MAQALDRATSLPPLVASMGRTERYRSSVGRDHRGPSPVGLRPADPPTVSAVYPPAAPPASRFPPPAPAGPTPTHWPRAAALDYSERQAAFRVGYESPSQFSREYRRLFGAPPRQDVAALKGASQPAGYSHV